jgi:hypothetical protein
MKILHKSTNTGEVMGIERHGGLSGPFLCDVFIGDKGETPKLGAMFFLPPLEESGTVFGKDSDSSLVKDYFAIVVTEFSDAHEIVFERRHDLGIAVWEVEMDISLSHVATLFA